MISLKKSDSKTAESIVKDVISKSPKNITAMMVLGKIYSFKREYNLAQKEYERILSIDPKDSYSQLSLGNIYYMATYDNKKKEEKKFLKWANDFYWKVWKDEPNNIFAASGIGMILAEKDKLAAAQLIFTQVREGSTDMPDAWINLANTFMAQSNFSKVFFLIFFDLFYLLFIFRQLNCMKFAPLNSITVTTSKCCCISQKPTLKTKDTKNVNLHSTVSFTSTQPI